MPLVADTRRRGYLVTFICRKILWIQEEVQVAFSKKTRSSWKYSLHKYIPANSENINLTHTGQFLTPGSQIRTAGSQNNIIISILFYLKRPYMPCLNSPNRVQTLLDIKLCSGLFPLQQRSEIVGSSSDIFGNVRKSLQHLRKSRYSEDKNLTHLTQEKLAGIKYSLHKCVLRIHLVDGDRSTQVERKRNGNFMTIN